MQQGLGLGPEQVGQGYRAYSQWGPGQYSPAVPSQDPGSPFPRAAWVTWEPAAVLRSGDAGRKGVFAQRKRSRPAIPTLAWSFRLIIYPGPLGSRELCSRAPDQDLGSRPPLGRRRGAEPGVPPSFTGRRGVSGRRKSWTLALWLHGHLPAARPQCPLPSGLLLRTACPLPS